jgi:uncharacterized membrane protein YqgA involved in biofilm formation
MLLPLGSLANALAIIVGGAVGLGLGARFPERVRVLVFQGLGLAVLLIGVRMALAGERQLLILVSIIAGAVIGELMCLEDLFLALGERLRRLVKSSSERFAEGFVAASLIYCIGSMAIVGALDEGLRNDHSVLYTKAILDGFASIALGSTHGFGVLFSAVPVFVYQFGLSLVAGACKDFFSPAMITDLTGLGGLLITAIGVNLLGLASIRIGNLLPSLVLLLVFAAIWA